MWYGSGTIAVTANGNNATGTGTQFLGNVRVGDGIAIQGSASLHEVTGVTSDTQLTFAPPYAGTAGSGRAFRIVPVLGYDKDLSDAFNALRLQFGDQLSNLQPWATAATQDAAQTALGMSVSGKVVATGTPAQGRTALALGTAAEANLTTSSEDRTTGRVLKFGDLGLGAAIIKSAVDFFELLEGTYVIRGHGDWNHSINRPQISNKRGTIDVKSSISGGYRSVHVYEDNDIYIHSPALSLGWRKLLNTGNTTVDSNGFIKNASPVIKLYADHIDSNIGEAPEFERTDIGHYQVIGTNGLRLDDGWYIETPHDKNGNKYFNVEWEQDVEPETDAGILKEPADVTLTIRCYERVWNPQKGQYDNGDPVDIPDGRWIDLRLNEVRLAELESSDEDDESGVPHNPTEPGSPVIPYSVTKAQGKAALIQAGLWQAVVDYVEGIEDETEQMLAEIALHDAQDYRRDSPFLNATADALGLTEERKDELFILASNILL